MDSTIITTFGPIWSLPKLTGQKLQTEFYTRDIDAQRYTLKLKEIAYNDLVKKTKIYTRLPEDVFNGNIAKIKNFTGDKFKYKLLRQLFIKFLKTRCPYLTYKDYDDLALYVGRILVLFAEENEDFEPENLWQILKNIYYLRAFDMILQIFQLYVDVNEERLRAFTYWMPDSFLCLFGEFLYFISIMHTDSDSPMVQIRKDATEGECLLMDQIATNVSPKLGILTYIVFRQSALLFHNIIVNGIIGRNLSQYVEVNQEIRDAYILSLEKIRKIPILDKYFDMFLNFLCIEINDASDCGCNVKHPVYTVEYLKIVQDDIDSMARHLGYVHDSNVLVFILRNVVDIFLYLYQVNGDFNFKILRQLPKILDNKPLPEYINNRDSVIFLKNGRAENVDVVLLTMSRLLDFLFIENWHLDIVGDYVQICNDIKVWLQSRSEAVKNIARDSCLFPFI